MDAAQLAPGTAWVGCAGWNLPGDAGEPFPPDGSQLQRYAAVFGAVEINSSFYRSHRASTYARWAASVPAAFRFSVKLPRTITHFARLADVDAALAQFASETQALGDTLGCVLAQLPPSLAFDAALADAFFTRLGTHFACQRACEARHPTWFDAAATQVLQAHGITRVWADPPVAHPDAHTPTAAASYLRLHGSPRMYYSAYAETYLAQLQAELGRRAAGGQPAWVIFDNTASGAALGNALAVRRAQSPSPGGGAEDGADAV